MIKGKQPLFGIIGWVTGWVFGVVLFLVGTELLGWNWLKLSSIVLIALFFTIWIADLDGWPLRKLGFTGMGLVTTVVSFVFGVATWEYIGVTDWDPYVMALPLSYTILFLFLVVKCFSFENGYLDEYSNKMKAFFTAILYFFVPYLLLKMGEISDLPLQKGVPIHWLPIGIFYFLSLGRWVTRKLKRTTRGVMNLFTVLFIASILVLILIHGIGAPKKVVVLNPQMLAWTAVLSATAVPLYVFLCNHPWNRLEQPQMGIVGLVMMFAVSAVEIQILHNMIDLFYLDIAALGFCVTAVEFMMALNFKYGIPECFEHLE